MNKKEPIDRLPAWARREIVNLREEVAKLRAELTGDFDPHSTKVWENRMIDPEVPYRPLGDEGMRVRFGDHYTAPNGYKSVTGVDVFWDPHEPRALMVMCDEHIRIEPQASNCVKIHLRPR